MARPVKILIVEDDQIQAGFTRPSLEQAFRGSEITHIRTEHEFHSRMDEIANNPPDVVVMDVMLRWTNPARDQPTAPDNVRLEGHYLAGIRCTKLLAENEKTKDIPVILYTVLERADIGAQIASLPNKTLSLTKASDASDLIQMIDRIRETKTKQS